MRLVTPILVALLLSPVHARGQGFFCSPPIEPYPYKIDKKTDREFYEFTRDEYQAYFEGMENYLRCLEQERADKLNELSTKFKEFKQNYGKDAVFRYER